VPLSTSITTTDDAHFQGVTKWCRLSWLTNRAQKLGQRGVAGSQPMSTAVHRSPNNSGDLTPYLTFAHSERTLKICSPFHHLILIILKFRGKGSEISRNCSRSSKASLFILPTTSTDNEAQGEVTKSLEAQHWWVIVTLQWRNIYATAAVSVWSVANRCICGGQVILTNFRPIIKKYFSWGWY
jgi:hypothetical protein